MEHATAPPPSFYRFFLLYIVASALVVLSLGWGVGIEFLTRILPGLPAMVPSTALCFVLLSLVLLYSWRWSSGGAESSQAGDRFIMLVAGGVVALIGCADLLVLATDMAHGIDALIFPHFAGNDGSVMSMATAICFIIAATALIVRAAVSADNVAGAKFILSLLSSAGLAISSISLVGHILNSGSLLNVAFFTGMSLQTSLLFVMLFLAQLETVPGRSWLSAFSGESIGSRGLRNLLPVVLIMPILLGWLLVVCTRYAILPVDFHVSVLVSAIMLFGLAAIVVNAQTENRLEQERDRNQTLEVALSGNRLLLEEVNRRVKSNLQQINVLLTLEAGGIANEQVRQSYVSMSGRLQALSLVHQSLLDSSEASEIELQEYLSKLCVAITNNTGLNARNISIEAKVEAMQVPFERAISLGLLMNELIAHWVKHAFSERDSGQILVQFISDPDRPSQKLLTVRGNSMGWGRNGKSFGTDANVGTQIIEALALQLSGSLETSTHRGAATKIYFNKNSFIGLA